MDADQVPADARPSLRSDGGVVAAALTTIDDVQDRVDALLLAIFEAVRGHDKAEEERSALISDVKLAYKSALESVEGLDCVDVSRSELLSRIASVQAQYQGSREAVLRLEEQLRGALRDTEARIEELVLEPSEDV